MKATELIEKLQKIVAENGDVEIHAICNEVSFDDIAEYERPIVKIEKSGFGDWIVKCD